VTQWRIAEPGGIGAGTGSQTQHSSVGGAFLSMRDDASWARKRARRNARAAYNRA
jgi:hypothetical protein